MKAQYRQILLILNFFLFINSLLIAQSGVIRGRVFNASNNEPLPFTNIIISGTNIGSTSDLDGNFLFTGITPGFITLTATSIGFENYTTEDFMVTNAKTVYVDIPMKEKSIKLSEVEIKASPFAKKEESPLSLRRLEISEIEKNPGGNRDISKVIQSLPGVASTPAYRNDVIIRGGGASENRFYLDGVEIPNLNHFATQGASGGPTGIINVDFIKEVNYYASAFPANRGNALSSVLEFQQIDGNPDKTNVKTALGASDFALTLNGPINDKATYIFSVRRSYLQFLFSVIGLPFLPIYNDFQFKTRYKIDKKNEITIIGLGAIDNFELNLKANETEEQRYILSYLPVNEQWNYTTGFVYKHFKQKGFDTWVYSRNYLHNVSYKFKDNDESKPENQLLDYSSDEIENKFRYENLTRWNDYKLISGAGAEYAKYFNETKQKIFKTTSLEPISFYYKTFLELYKWNAFAQLSRTLFDSRLTLSLGVRTDGNSYSKEMANVLKQISPRFSASYGLTEKLFWNSSVGRYYQLPAYTTLGYKNNQGVLINQYRGLKYIQVDHIVSGFEYEVSEKNTISIEGFYKLYDKYPFSLTDSVTIASKGADFGTFGDEEVLSVGKGRAYGVELLAKNTWFNSLKSTVSYTFVRSEFTNKHNEYIPSAWDNIHLLNITLTNKFKKNWYIGAKWKYVGGAPYTPYDFEKSSNVIAWNLRGRGYLDYDKYNSNRLKAFHQLDVRIDKEYFYKKYSFILYLDIQNLYGFAADRPSDLILKTDENQQPIILNPTDPIYLQKYDLKYINTASGTVLPTIGIIFEF